MHCGTQTAAADQDLPGTTVLLSNDFSAVSACAEFAERVWPIFLSAGIVLNHCVGNDVVLYDFFFDGASGFVKAFWNADTLCLVVNDTNFRPY